MRALLDLRALTVVKQHDYEKRPHGLVFMLEVRVGLPQRLSYCRPIQAGASQPSIRCWHRTPEELVRDLIKIAAIARLPGITPGLRLVADKMSYFNRLTLQLTTCCHRSYARSTYP